LFSASIIVPNFEKGSNICGHNLYQATQTGCQAFSQGEVTPEEAHRIGYEAAMRWTKSKYQFLSAPIPRRATISFTTMPRPMFCIDLRGPRIVSIMFLVGKAH